MQNRQRRDQILDIIKESGVPVSGADLAERLGVSRQVIVQDIALIRAEGHEVISTNRGYLLTDTIRPTRVFRVKHRDDEIEDELLTIIDLGGTVLDVFIRHDVYGRVRGRMGIDSRKKITDFLEKLKVAKSKPLNNITDGYHFHTVEAADTQTLDLIEEKLREKGYLVANNE